MALEIVAAFAARTRHASRVSDGWQKSRRGVLRAKASFKPGGTAPPEPPRRRVPLVPAILVVCGLIALLIFGFRSHQKSGPHPAPAVGSAHAPTTTAARGSAATPSPATPSMPASPGQGKATIETVAGPGSVSGRVINWSTGDGVGGADLSFAGASGVVTARSADDGAFELAAGPGSYRLATVAAPGFLPFAPEWDQSTVVVEVVPERKVGGVTVFLFPAVDYTGTVVDHGGTPVAGAKVRLLGNPSGEQVLEGLPTEWTTDAKGTFAFHAPDDSMFEAERRGIRGRAVLDGDAQLTHQLVIQLGAAQANDLSIDGRVVDTAGAPVVDVQVSADPVAQPGGGGAAISANADLKRIGGFATTDADGKFALHGLDDAFYALTATADGFAPAWHEAVHGGAHDVTITVDAGKPLAGTVKTKDGDVVAAFTLLVIQRDGAARNVVIARSIVNAEGKFAVRVADGTYDLVAAPPGWAPSPPTTADAGDTTIALVVTAGATISGTVSSARDGSPIQYARVNRESTGGGASVQPANAGTVTDAAGHFALTGVPPGPVSLAIGAGEFNPKIESGLVATEGMALGPLAIALTPLDGGPPKLELVGIGVKLVPDGDALRVDGLVPGGAAEGAGVVVGDRLSAVDGAPVTELGMDGAVARIRGVEGSPVTITLLRDPPVDLTVIRRKLKS